MKILYKKVKPDVYRKVIYSIEEVDKNTVVLKFKLPNEVEKPKTFSTTLNLKDMQGHIFEIDLVNTEIPNQILIVPVFENWTWANQKASRIVQSDDMRLARVVVEDGEFIIQLMYPTDYLTGFKCEAKLDNETSVGQLMRFSKLASNIVQKAKIKSASLGDIDNGDSLAYIECQVDALIRYVMSKDSESKEILKWADKYSVLDIKPLDKIISEFEHKKKIRERQTSYYATTQSLSS